jgi:hypothetical protein
MGRVEEVFHVLDVNSEARVLVGFAYLQSISMKNVQLLLK